MVRTQIQIEENQYERIRQLAHRKRISMSETVRRLLRRGLEVGLEQQDGPQAQSLLKIAGIAKGPPSDLGRRHDHYLIEDIDS